MESTGVTYRRRAESHVFGVGNTAGVFTADAGWDFNLTIPEPTTATLILIALLATTSTPARRRRHHSPIGSQIRRGGRQPPLETLILVTGRSTGRATHFTSPPASAASLRAVRLSPANS